MPIPCLLLLFAWILFFLLSPNCALVCGRQPRLLFAGEHCHPSFYSTVHGAYLTGRSVVRQILSATAPSQSAESRPDAETAGTDTIEQPDEGATDLSAWLAGIDLT